MKKKALEWEAIVKSKISYDINYTGIKSDRRFFWGFIGEFAFGLLLRQSGISAVYHVALNGHGDKEDFTLIGSAGSRLLIDVKTASPSTYHNDKLLVNKKQHGDKDSTIYVGVSLHKGEAHIHGFKKVSEMLLNQKGFTKKQEPTYYMLNKHLTPIERLLTYAQKGTLETKIIT